MSVGGRCLVLLLVMAGSAAAAPCPSERRTAPATRTPEELATANSLFAKGVALQQSNKLDEACKMFESSLHLAPQIGTWLNVADCRERKGELVEAHELYLSAADEASRTKDRRLAFATQRATAIEAKLVRVKIQVAEPDLKGLAVEIDTCTLEKSDFGTIRFASPGPIVVRANAPGRKPFLVEQDGLAGSEVAIEIPALAVDRDVEAERKAKEAEALAAVERRKTEQIAAEREAAKRYNLHPARKWTVLAGGVGAAVIGAGVLFAFRAKSAQTSFDDAGCGDPSHDLVSAEYSSCLATRDRGERSALLANTLLIAGGAIVVSSTLVFVIDPGNVERPHSVAVAVRW